MVFDLLYHAGWSLMREALVRRREALVKVSDKLAVPQVVLSPAVIGTGTAFYHRVVAAGQEGVMAKLLTSA